MTTLDLLDLCKKCTIDTEVVVYCGTDGGNKGKLATISHIEKREEVIHSPDSNAFRVQPKLIICVDLPLSSLP